ncbi:hypothetical protein INR49_003983 [Caranx melampygus]|nr:hypothetical protein INR49_003983 [Caranx melampygus]
MRLLPKRHVNAPSLREADAGGDGRTDRRTRQIQQHSQEKASAGDGRTGSVNAHGTPPPPPWDMDKKQEVDPRLRVSSEQTDQQSKQLNIRVFVFCPPASHLSTSACPSLLHVC